MAVQQSTASSASGDLKSTMSSFPGLCQVVPGVAASGHASFLPLIGCAFVPQKHELHYGLVPQNHELFSNLVLRGANVGRAKLARTSAVPGSSSWPSDSSGQAMKSGQLS